MTVDSVNNKGGVAFESNNNERMNLTDSLLRGNGGEISTNRKKVLN